MLWRVEFKDGSPLGGPPLANGERPCLLVLFEFQSAVDPDMAWRMHEYVYLLQRHQRSNGTLKAEGRGAAGAGGGGVQRGPSVDGGGCAVGAGGGGTVGGGLDGESHSDPCGAR